MRSGGAPRTTTQCANPGARPFLEEALTIARLEPGMYEIVRTFSPIGRRASVVTLTLVSPWPPYRRFRRRFSPAPVADREHTLAHRGGNLDGLQPGGCSRHDPGPPHHTLRRVSVADQTFQAFTISIADRYPFDLSHRRRLAGLRQFLNPPSKTEH